MASTSRRSSSPMTPMLHKPISFGNFRQRLPGGRRGSSSSGVRFPNVMAGGGHWAFVAAVSVSLIVSSTGAPGE